MLNSFLVLSCFLGQTASFDAKQYAPTYHELADHPWNAVHKKFFVRTFNTGETYYHRLSFDVPWGRFQRLSNQDSEYHDLLKLIDAIDQLPRDEMETAAPVRRLLFFRDMWTVFEELHHMTSKERKEELRRRLARIMSRLELTDDEIQHLPDTLAMNRDKAVFPESFDPKHPEKPFLPTTLLKDDSEWITISASKESALGAPAHTESVNKRSLFTIHMYWPEGRAAGEQFIAAEPLKDAISFPPGTTLALLRRAVAASNRGKLKVTNVVESLQLIVSPAAMIKQDARFKFVLDRYELISGRAALVALNADSPLDAFSFESTGQWRMTQLKDTDEETLVLGYGKGHVGVPSMQHCIVCHGLRNTKFHANFGQFPVFTSTNSKLAATLEKTKEESDSWREYMQLREKP